MNVPESNGWKGTAAILIAIVGFGIGGIRAFGKVEERLAIIEVRLATNEEEINVLKNEGSLPVRKLDSQYEVIKQMLDQNAKDHVIIKEQLKDIEQRVK